MTTTQEAIIQRAKIFSKKSHQGTNQKYGLEDYFEAHILRCERFAQKYIYLIPLERRHIAMAIVYLHDTIEDCRVTYSTLREKFGEEIANGVYALTNEKGKTRKERANKKYYKIIRDTDLAIFGKLIDRMANISYGLENSGGMIGAYAKEHENFIKSMQGKNTFVGYIKFYIQKFHLVDDIDYNLMYNDLNEMVKNGRG